MFDMSGKVVLVTGGCGWLGSAFCLALAEVGATVVVSSRDQERATAQAQALPTPKGADAQQHAGVVLDHMEEASIKTGFAQAVAAAGRVDVLINNGLSMSPGDISNISFEAFAKVGANNAGYFVLGQCKPTPSATT